MGFNTIILFVILLFTSPAYALGPMMNFFQVDAAPAGCVATETPEATCNDGIDNDCDGLTDMNDPDCQTNYVSEAATVFAAYMNADGSTAETDRSASATNVTVSTGDTIPRSTMVPSGYSGYSRDFERNDNDFLSHADNNATDLSGANQTISFGGWLYPESISNDMMILGKGGNVGGTDVQYFLTYNTTADAFYCTLSADGTAYTTATSADGLTSAAWAHVACVYNDTDIRIYVNGALSSNGASNPRAYTAGIGVSGNTGIFRIGSFGGSRAYDGLMDEVFVRNDALSSAQVLEIYNYGLTGNRGGND